MPTPARRVGAPRWLGRLRAGVRGDRYRIVVAVNYPYRVVYIRFVGTHDDYDQIDVATV